MDKKEQLTSIIKATTEVQKYFLKKKDSSESRIQAIKQELFELDIRLDEQGRTRNMYAMNTNSRKNVFSPIQTDDKITEKESRLEETIRTLMERKEKLSQELDEEQALLADTDARLKLLRTALHSAAALGKDPAFFDDPELDAFEFLEPPEQHTDLSEHGERILNLDAFDRSYLTAILEKKVLSPLEAGEHKLENLQRMIRTDPQQAQLMAGDLVQRGKRIRMILKDQLDRLQPDFDASLPVNRALDNWIMQFREQHPEFVMDASVHIKNETLILPYIRELILFRLLGIFTDNIVQHASANQIRLRIQINNAQADVFISDNGVGIPTDYEKKVPWYSSLHKAEELLFLLNGHMQITGAKDYGTTVRFSIPLPSNDR